GIDGDLLVPVIRSSNDHSIHILAGEDLAVVARGKNVVSPHLFAVFETSVVAIRNRDQLHSRNLQRRPRVSLALSARADQRNLDMIVRRRLCRSFGLRREGMDVSCEHGGCGSLSCGFQKASAREHGGLLFERSSCFCNDSFKASTFQGALKSESVQLAPSP